MRFYAAYRSVLFWGSPLWTLQFVGHLFVRLVWACYSALRERTPCPARPTINRDEVSTVAVDLIKNLRAHAAPAPVAVKTGFPSHTIRDGLRGTGHGHRSASRAR